jgi:hypothetical protein
MNEIETARREPVIEETSVRMHSEAQKKICMREFNN